jgi:hypothetical protein
MKSWNAGIMGPRTMKCQRSYFQRRWIYENMPFLKNEHALYEK